MTDNFTPKNAQKFCCEKCDFICSKNSDLERHLLTRKHKNTYKLHKNTDAESAENAEVTNNFICECNKSINSSCFCSNLVIMHYALFSVDFLQFFTLSFLFKPKSCSFE